jgi:hypothetical protein
MRAELQRNAGGGGEQREPIDVKAADSPYYPPRAGRIGRNLNRWYRIRRTLELERFVAPAPARSWPRFALWLLVPGTLGLARGQRSHGGALLAVWLTALAAHFVWIDAAWASWMRVIAASIHSISAAMVFAACTRLPDLPRDNRFARASAYGFLLVLALYVFLPMRLADRVVLPIQIQGKTILINTLKPVRNLRRGDWIAYEFENGMIGFDRILALPGETIRFGEESFTVDGTAYQRVSEQMPSHGEISVSNEVLYVWPAGARYAHAGEREAELLAGIAIVPKHRVLGPAYRHWFWRTQALEPLTVLKDQAPPATTP